MSRGRKVSEAYPIQTLHKIFLLSGGLFLLSMLWMVWDDYDRPWKAYQREFMSLQREKKQRDLARISKLQKQISGLDAKIATLKSKISRKSKKLVELRAKLADVKRRLIPAVQEMKFKKGEVDAAKYIHDHAAELLIHAEHALKRAKQKSSPSLEKARRKMKAAKVGLDAKRKEYRDKQTAVQKLEMEKEKHTRQIEAIESKMKETRQLAKLEERRAPLSAELGKLLAQEKELADDLGFKLRNAPILDMLNPNIKVRQVVLPKMTFNIFFADVQTVDRCMTCHLAVDKPGWDTRTHKVTGEQYAALAASHGPKFRPVPKKAKWSAWANVDDTRLAAWIASNGYVQLKEASKARKKDVVRQTDLAAYKARWGKLLEVGKKKRNKETKQWEVPVSYPESAKGRALVSGVISHPYQHPFRSHPELSLYMGSTSPHPMNQFGCRSCHNGMGRATDFVRATHTPGSPKQEQAWVKKFGWHMLHDKEWKKPQWPMRYVESGCVKCHGDIVDLQPMPWTQAYAKRTKPAKPSIGIYDHYSGQKVYEGKRLFLRYGCNGCHAVEGIKDQPKVGPSLAHVRSKLTRSWMRKWIEAPREFRPNTWMPHVFKIKHQLAPLADVATTDLDFGSLAKKPGFKKLGNMKKKYKNRKKLLEAIHDAEIAAVAEYLFQNSTRIQLKTPEVQGSVETGKGLFRDKGCLACHKMDDFPVAGEPAKRFGPDLSQVGSKLEPAVAAKWLYTWLLDPRSYHRASRMPDPRLETAEAAHLAAYLASKRLPAGHAFTKRRAGKAFPNLIEMRLVSFLEGNMRTDQAWKVVGMLDQKTKLAWLGEKVISKQGCFGCHIMPEGDFVQRKIAANDKLKGFLDRSRLTRFTRAARFNSMPGVGTELSDWGTKLMTKLDFGLLREEMPHTRWAFITTKLKTPRIYDRGLFKPYDDMLRMPYFGLTDDEADKIATFVMGQQKGKLGQQYLYAQTDKNYQKRPWQLQAESWRRRLESKPVGRWSVADRRSLGAAARRMASKVGEKDRTRLEQVSKGLAKGELSQEDASFVLSVQDRLEGYTAPQWTAAISRRQAIVEGRQLVQQFNCQGCHLIEGRGWELKDYMNKYPFPGLRPAEVDEATPPYLSQVRWSKDYQARWRNFQGARTKTSWLFEFLRDPDSSPTLRPWLRVRMPDFYMTVEQANTLTRYFAALQGTAWPNDRHAEAPSDADYAKAAAIFKTNDCFGCHRPKPAAGKKGAPDLELAAKRLRADWVSHWIYKPSQFIPFTAMPSGQIPDMDTARAVTRVIMNRDAVRRLKKQFGVPLSK